MTRLVPRHIFIFACKGGGGGGGFQKRFVVANRMVVCIIPDGQRGGAAAVVRRDVLRAGSQAHAAAVHDGDVGTE